VNYFKEIEKQGVDYLYEAKLLIVGEARVGKTTLCEKIKDIHAPLPHEKDSTHGIEVVINDDTFVTKDNHPFITHIWDFGGQVIYHATHQFFLTKRSLYVLVDDASRDDVDLEYWFQVIEKLTDSSPVIILQNQKIGRSKDIGYNEIRGRYKNVLDYKQIDLSLNDQINKEKFRNLKNLIQLHMEQLPLVGTELPKSWIEIRKKLNVLLKEDELSFITKEKYLEICYENGINEEVQIQHLSRALHDLGVFLYFIDHPVLSNIIILENEWATKAVYDLLTDSLINDQKGKFQINDVYRVWNDTKFRSKHFELIELMKMFELIYELHVTNGRSFIATQLLPTSRPKYIWDYENNLRLVYEYPFLPKGLISRLIVRLSRFIREVKNDAWRKGVVLQRGFTKAEIKEVLNERKIEIRLKGDECKEFLAIISDELYQLNQSYNNLPVEKLIPCICEACKERDEKLNEAKDDSERATMDRPHFYKFSDLKRRLANNIEKVQCEISYKVINVQDLLDNIYRTSYPGGEEEYIKSGKLKVFISYSKENSKAVETFDKYIAPLSKTGKIEVFYDLKSIEGEKIHQRIRTEINESNIILFFISSDSLATDYITDIEIPTALERYKAKHDKVILFPVVLEECLWEDYFGDYYIYNKAKPLLEIENQKKEWTNLARRLREVVQNFETQSSKIIKEDEN